MTEYHFETHEPVRLYAEIGKGSIGPAIWLGCISLTSGVVSAACMSY